MKTYRDERNLSGAVVTVDNQPLRRDRPCGLQPAEFQMN